MHKKLLTFLILFVCIASALYFTNFVDGQASARGDTVRIQSDGGFERYIENNAYGVGERLDFSIDYGFINAGYASMEVVDLIEFNNRPCYLAVSEAYSNKFFTPFFRVEDRVESVIDAVGIFSWHFEKHLIEGSYTSNRVYTFNHADRIVVYEGDTIDIPAFVQDALSILYFTRTQELKVGESIYIPNFIDGKQNPLEVRVIRKETVTVDAGRFDCIVVEPLLLTAGVFKHEGRLRVWLTDDRLKLPVMMKTKVVVGSITAELQDYRLGEIVEF